MPAKFLTAEWRTLAMLNYEVDPAILLPLVPSGTELDLFAGRALVSVVGFMFLNTKLLGVPIPYHRNFEELNLRFYVRRRHPDGDRRGVVFIKELVPRWCVAAVARWVYNENYVSLPMRHDIRPAENEPLRPAAVEYSWKFGGRWNRVRLETAGPSQTAADGSEEEFITEHYWGYTRQRNGGTIEYEVQHPRWKLWPTKMAEFEADVAALYGPRFVDGLSAAPRSAFLADGSAVAVYSGTKLPATMPA